MCERQKIDVSADCCQKMAYLSGSYQLKYKYLAETVDELARQQIECILGGFSGVKITIHEREAKVIFADREDCLFAYQRHHKIEIVPGEVEWRFRMIDDAQAFAREK